MINDNNFFSFDIDDDQEVNIKIDNNKTNIKIKDREFNMITLYKIYKKINKIIEKYINNSKLNIQIISDVIQFDTPYTYYLFEILLYRLCKTCKFGKIKIKNNSIKIFRDGDLNNSFLFRIRNRLLERNEFLSEYSALNISLTNYRKIVKYEKDNKKNASKLYSDLAIFLKPYKINENFKEEFIEVLVELVSNANEHAKSDCLIELSLSEAINLENDENILIIHAFVVNFSDILLGTGMKEKLNTISSVKDFTEDLRKAFLSHKTFFNDVYSEEDFYNISAFQWRFSGRKDIISDNGGTGLTTLLKLLIEFSKADACLVFSGNRGIVFYSELLHENELKHVGFNYKKDYLKCPPEKSCLLENPFFINGTLYNFNFIIPRE